MSVFWERRREGEECLAVDMMVEIYERKPMELEAVRITDANIREVAEWCEAEVISTGPNPSILLHGNKHGKYKPHLIPVGHWVTFNGLTYKIYHDNEFTRLFQKKAS